MSTKYAPPSRRVRRHNLLIERLENRIYLSGEPIATLPSPDPCLNADVPVPIVSTPTPAPIAPTETPTVTSGDFSRAVDAINQFAYELYRHFQQQQGNLFLSPMSIATALAMTYAGASGETAAQMAEVFHFGSDPGIHDSFRALLNSLNSSGASGTYALDVANALWPQKDFPFRNDYLQLIQNEYSGGSQNLDYRADAEGARQIINAWVAEQTHDKIKDLIPEGALNAATRLVLTNAIYFKGQWATAFDPALTRDQPFYLDSGQTVNVPTMHLSSQFHYCEMDGYQVLEMLYKGGDLSMLILLPKSRGALPDLGYGTLVKINDWLNNSGAMRDVIVDLPKFKMTVSSDLKDVLSGMGMPLAFDKYQADFSAMANLGPDERLYIDKVLHKAFVEVNEEGTEAAAATAVITFHCTCVFNPPPPTFFTADHAFQFLIRDNHTGAVLFMGRMTNPTLENNSVDPKVGENNAADGKGGANPPVENPQPPQAPEWPIDTPYPILHLPTDIIKVLFPPPNDPVNMPAPPIIVQENPLPIAPPKTVVNPASGVQDSILKADFLGIKTNPRLTFGLLDRVFGELGLVGSRPANRFDPVNAADSFSKIPQPEIRGALQPDSSAAAIENNHSARDDRRSPLENAVQNNAVGASQISDALHHPAARIFAEADDQWQPKTILAELPDVNRLQYAKISSHFRRVFTIPLNDAGEDFGTETRPNG